jgi:MFS family permease
VANDQQTESLVSTLVSSSPLFAGLALLMLGNGLQGSLLGVRASQEHFGDILIGVIMAAFFIGFLAGSWWTPRALRKVGYVRVFAALASVASIAILIQALRVAPVTWLLMRFVTGLCYAGIYVVAESWLNRRATNTTRGQLLSTYMVTMYLGMGGGQFLLNMADPASADLFIVASVLISLSVVPLLLSASQGPDATSSTPMPLRRLVRISPFGTAGVFIAGVVNGTVFGMGAVYAHKTGLSVAQVALFMAALIGGGAILQWPIGRLSDHCDRRLVIIGVALAGAAAAMLADRSTEWPVPWMVLSVGLFGGLAFTIHSLNLARTNDCLHRDEMLNASGALVLLLGMGSILGPLAVGGLMRLIGPPGFFYWLAGVQILFGLFGIACWRYYAKRPDTKRTPYLAVPNQASIVGSSAVEQAYAAQKEAGQE